MIRRRDGCNHIKQTKSNYPNVVSDFSGIYDQVQENAGYQELGQVYIPAFTKRWREEFNNCFLHKRISQ